MHIPSISQLVTECNYTHSHISRVLKGHSDPSLKCARSLANAIGVSLDAFVAYITPELDVGAKITDPPTLPSTIALWPLESE